MFVSHIVSHRAHGMSDKHVILIASRCYFLMLPSSGDSWGTAGRSEGKGDIEFHAPLSAVGSLRQAQGGASWVGWLKKQGQVSHNISNNNHYK